MNRALLCGIVLAVGAGVSWPVRAASGNFTGTLALSSELVDRGQAITSATPILQAAATWAFRPGWSAGVSGSAAVRSPGRIVEGIAQVARYWQLSDAWQLQASLLYYQYPGNARSGALDRTEAGIHLTYRDVLTASLSAIRVGGVRNHGPRGAFDLALHWPLARRLYLAAGVGITQPVVARYYDDDYRRPTGYARTDVRGYGQVGLLWRAGAWQIEVDRFFADAATRERWGDLHASPWAATVAWSF